MEKKDFEDLQRVRREANNDAKESVYNSEAYHAVWNEFLKVGNGKNLHENNRNRFMKLSLEIEKSIKSSVANNKFKIPYKAWEEMIFEMFREIHFNENDSDTLQQNTIAIYEKMFEKYVQLDGNIPKEIGEKLYSLYTNPEVSLGVHGTSGKIDMYSLDNSYFKYGLGCEYHDLTKTVGFQRGRGARFNHSERNFLEILTYNFSRWKMKDDEHQFTYFIAIPTELSTCNNQLFEEGRKTCMENTPYGYLERPIEERKRLKNMYIVGMMMNGDCQTFMDNPNFDLELLLQQNDIEKKVNKEEEKRIIEQIGIEVKPYHREIRIKR